MGSCQLFDLPACLSVLELQQFTMKRIAKKKHFLKKKKVLYVFNIHSITQNGWRYD